MARRQRVKDGTQALGPLSLIIGADLAELYRVCWNA
jgi:hypothetical protein